MNIRTSANTRIGAIQYADCGGVHIRVYCQGEYHLSLKGHLFIEYLKGAGSRAIRELCNDGHWFNGSLDLPDALDGTTIAAVAYNWGGRTNIRVYYQAEDLSLREHCHDNKGWYPGQSVSSLISSF